VRDIVALFREEGAEVFAESWDMTKPEMADEIVRKIGHVDILIANLAYPHTYAPAHEKTDADLKYAMQRIMYPLHRLTRAVLPQVLERKRRKIVVVGSATSLRGRKGGVAVYGAGCGAQHGYMKNVAMEVAPYVNINATAQTYVDNITYWPMHYRETPEFRERMAETRPRAWPPVANARKPCCSWPGAKATFSMVRSSRLPGAGQCSIGAVERLSPIEPVPVVGASCQE
jgi:2-keto-3-deoxy-L-fuconate dehydrogenase